MKIKLVDTSKIAKKIKNKIKLYVFDYDGTIYDIGDKKFNHQKAFLLIKKVLLKKRFCLILSARCSSFFDLHIKNFEKFYKKNQNIKPIFIGGGNGSILYQYSNKGLFKIYDNALTFEEAKIIMKLGKKIYLDLKITSSELNDLGIKIHKSFLKKNWLKLIPNNFIEENKLYKGICFSEEAKVAFILPNNIKSHKKIINLFKDKISQNLDNKFSVVKGDDVFLQISRSFKIDPKLYALKTIIKKLNLKDEQVAVFGNMPEGNDRGILIDSHLPFTFTNLKVESIHNFIIKSLQ
ncbi:MAG: HAD hydrolase family protein [Patescibacteria group bacterium]